MDSPLSPRTPAAVAAPPVRLRTGLLFLGTSVAAVAIVAWGGRHTTRAVADLEARQARFELHLARVEQLMGGTPTTVVAADPASRPHQAREGE